MRIYRVNGHKLWSSYRSAVTSAAQRGGSAGGDKGIEYIDVPEHSWRPVDKQEESRRTRLQTLAAMVTWQDPKVAVDVLTTLMKEAHGRLRASKARLSDAEKAEVDKLLGRLVDVGD